MSETKLTNMHKFDGARWWVWTPTVGSPMTCESGWSRTSRKEIWFEEVVGSSVWISRTSVSGESSSSMITSESGLQEEGQSRDDVPIVTEEAK